MSTRWSSALLAATITGFFDRRRTAATASSMSVAPIEASTTNSTASASCIPISACAAIRPAKPLAAGSQPPVSSNVNARPAQLAS